MRAAEGLMRDADGFNIRVTTVRKSTQNSRKCYTESSRQEFEINIGCSILNDLLILYKNLHIKC